MMNDWTITTDEERTKTGFSGALFLDIDYKVNEHAKEDWKMSLSLCGSTRHDQDWTMFLVHIYFLGNSVLEFQVHDNCSLYRKLGRLHTQYRENTKAWRAGTRKTTNLDLSTEDKKKYFEMVFRGAVAYSNPIKLLMAANKIYDFSYRAGIRNNQEKICAALGIHDPY